MVLALVSIWIAITPPGPVPVAVKFSLNIRSVPALLSKFHILVDAAGSVSRSVAVPPEYPRRNCPRRSSFDHGVLVLIPISALLQRMTVFDCDHIAFAPMSVTFERFPLETFALYPIAVLLLPHVFDVSAIVPTAVLLLHVLL